VSKNQKIWGGSALTPTRQMVGRSVCGFTRAKKASSPAKLAL
jgi:hypothetical protein